MPGNGPSAPLVPLAHLSINEQIVHFWYTKDRIGNDYEELVLTNQQVVKLKGSNKAVDVEVCVPLSKVSTIVLAKWLSKEQHSILGSISALVGLILTIFAYQLNINGDTAAVSVGSVIAGGLSSAFTYALGYLILKLCTGRGISIYCEGRSVIAFKPSGSNVAGIRQAIRSQQYESDLRLHKTHITDLLSVNVDDV
eukprot:TRINITY_DN4154_c0_g1_i2.p1 TRINITY_DN4154_c0_g1~~TRINITY_DN4154_c0_g1_i2.p1  ORF type:complete len:196 (-),score=33.71 TRINITY_DN4154_c0_g1_i2:424-1011(-)